MARPRRDLRQDSPVPRPTAQILTTPRYTFSSVREYEECYRAGTEFELDLERQGIDRFNQKRTVFPAKVFCKLEQEGPFQHWVIAVDAGDVPSVFPKEGDKCIITLFDATGETQVSSDWDACRIASSLHPLLETYAVFKVTMRAHIAAHTLLHPLVDSSKRDSPETASDEALSFDESNTIHVIFTLEYNPSSATTELDALNVLAGGDENSETRSRQIFEYIVRLKNPAFRTNLFEAIPHMRDAIDNLDNLPPRLRERALSMNESQKAAYQSLENLPCGIGVIPGGPGGGKTFFNLCLTAFAQAKPIHYEEDGVKKERRVKILYLLDINQPIDDTVSKCVKMSEDLGDDKVIVRMFGWGREMQQGLKRRKKNSADASILPAFLEMAKKGPAEEVTPEEARVSCRAPTLDQLAFRRFADRKTEYEELDELLNEYATNPEFKDFSSLRDATFSLYKDTLDEADFVAATPVAAACLADGKYKPDLILFDEAPHARELTNLIAFAYFSPAAVILTGDFRQTGCFLASKNQNPWEVQMRMSIMERAFHAGVVDHELLINHRARGNLQQIASDLFYDGKMVTGHTPSEMIPVTTKYLCSYLEKFTGHPITTPRLMVHAWGCALPTKVGTSFFNSMHEEWIMDRVQELIKDPSFLGVDGKTPGTILIISPYKEAFMRYSAATKALQAEGRLDVLIEPDSEKQLKTQEESQSKPVATTAPVVTEARTVDTVQGHEADIVFIDLVRERATTFLDDPKRLAVATTRARQAEIYVMQPSMFRTLPNTQNLGRIYEACRTGRQGHVAWVGLRGFSRKRVQRRKVPSPPWPEL